LFSFTHGIGGVFISATFAAECTEFGSIDLFLGFFVVKMRDEIGFTGYKYAEMETRETGERLEGLCERDLNKVR